MNSYELSRSWFDFSFENPEKVKPIHTAIYFFAIDHCNRLGSKEKFGFPSLYVMEALSVKSKNTYYNAFNQLVEWGFLKIIEKSKNQNSANIISISAISKFKSADKSARDIATIRHVSRQEDSTDVGSCVGGGNIDKPTNQETKKPSNQLKKEKEEKEKTITDDDVYFPTDILVSGYLENDRLCNAVIESQKLKSLDELKTLLSGFEKHLVTTDDSVKTKKDFATHFLNWVRKRRKSNSENLSDAEKLRRGYKVNFL